MSRHFKHNDCLYLTKILIFKLIKIKYLIFKYLNSKFLLYPRPTVTSQPGRFDISAIKQLHVVIAAVSFLLSLKGVEDELHPVALLRWDHPLAVWCSGIVVVTKLCVGIQILGLYLCLQTTATLWEQEQLSLTEIKRSLWRTSGPHQKIPAEWEALKPLFCTELSEKNCRNMLLPLEMKADGFLLPQMRPKLVALPFGPSYISKWS